MTKTKTRSTKLRPFQPLLQPGASAGFATHRGVTFMEVLLVIGMVLLLLAILFPGLGKVRELSRRIQCQNNLKQWGFAMQCYRDEFNDYLPMEGTTGTHGHKVFSAWYNVLPPYLDAPAYRDVEGAGKNIREFPELHMWICPSKNLSKAYKSVSGMNQYHYGMNIVLDKIRPPSDEKNR